MASSLPYDLVIEILCRLGVKDLLRFRCVSKSFRSSIDDPYFINFHLSRSLETNTNRSLIFRRKEPNNGLLRYYLYSVEFESLEKPQKLGHPLDQTEILGSCNGLLALCNGHEDITLLNPSTRKSKLLPPFTHVPEFPPGASVSQMIISYGFGYDRISDDYKLVRIIQSKSLDSEVKVYSLRTNSWRRIQDFPFYLKYGRHYGVFANNALHWIVYKNPVSDTDQSFIVALDLETEAYRVIEFPARSDWRFLPKLRAIGGCLSLLALHWKGGHEVITDIWMMKEYGVQESWTKFTSIKEYETTQVFHFVFPVAFSKNGEKLLLHIDAEKFGWYDIKSKIIDAVSMEGHPSIPLGLEMLVESLVPLNDNGAMINKKTHRGTNNK